MTFKMLWYKSIIWSVPLICLLLVLPNATLAKRIRRINYQRPINTTVNCSDPLTTISPNGNRCCRLNPSLPGCPPSQTPIPSLEPRSLLRGRSQGLMRNAVNCSDPFSTGLPGCPSPPMVDCSDVSNAEDVQCYCASYTISGTGTTPNDTLCCRLKPSIVGCPSPPQGPSKMNCSDPFSTGLPECPAPPMVDCTDVSNADNVHCYCASYTISATGTTPNDTLCCRLKPSMDGCPTTVPPPPPVEPTEPPVPPPEPPMPPVGPPVGPLATSRPSKPLKLYDSCVTDRDKCDKNFYLQCMPLYENQHNEGKKQGTCGCVASLWSTESDTPCSIPYDGPCKGDSDRPDGYKHLPPPICYGSASCIQINDNPFCRASEENDFPMFVSPERASRLSEMKSLARSAEDEQGGSTSSLYYKNWPVVSALSFLAATSLWTTNDFM